MPRITLSDRVVGARIRDARQRKGWHQTDLAAALSLDPSTIRQWELALIGFPEGRAHEVAEALSIPPADLYPVDVLEVTPDERDLLEAYRRIGSNATGKASIHRVIAAIETARGSMPAC